MPELDVSMLEFLSPVFSFLFIFAVVYAVLDKFKLMGDNRSVKVVAAFSIALLFLFSAPARNFISLTTPWFAILLVGALMLLSIFMFIGLSESDLAKAAKDVKVYWSIIIIGLLVFTIALVQVFETGSSDLKPGPRTFEGINALVHPRVLGAIFLLIVAAFAVKFISESMT